MKIPRHSGKGNDEKINRKINLHKQIIHRKGNTIDWPLNKASIPSISLIRQRHINTTMIHFSSTGKILQFDNIFY